MSEKRKPVSIYLSPRATLVLQDYSRGSGYGSISRTVEEIILAFDGVYKSMRIFKQMSDNIMPTDPQKQREKARLALLYIGSLLQSIENMLSRLTPENQ